MYNKLEQYVLSFVPSERRPVRRMPQIALSIQSKYAEELYRRIELVAKNSKGDAELYFDDEVEFVPPHRDMFGRIEFGYGSCAAIIEEDDRTHVHVELRKEKVYCASYTLKTLIAALNVPFSKDASNRFQQIDLNIRADRSDCYGHALGGYVSGSMRAWLRAYAAGKDVYAPESVVRAMRSTWAALVDEDQREWAKECRAIVSKDGRFRLECLGNACDVAIYPDQSSSVRDDSVQFGCHNLDQARQQLTLLAGLARLCEIARTSE